MKLTRKHQQTSHSNVRLYAYIIGFGLSIILTLAAYVLVTQHTGGSLGSLSHSAVIGIVLVLAMIQLTVQLVFFLHIGREEKPRWNLQVLLFSILIVSILVIGSIWIMANLDYNMQLEKPADVNNAIIEDEGFQNKSHENDSNHTYN